MHQPTDDHSGIATTTHDPVAEFTTWRDGLVANSAFRCEPMPLSASQQWSLRDGAVRHRTGGFFSLVGLRVTARRPELGGEQLIILQPETAINGFLLRAHPEGGQLLFQGRVEPGNAGVLQLAPTVQSTEANYKRLHGGKATACLSWFGPTGNGRIVYDELQSEEGTRYYGKYNRNVVVDVGTRAVECPSTFRWYGIDALRRFAVTSNVLNTDSRSVLAGLDWSLLAPGGVPFAGAAPGSFRAALLASHHAPEGCDAHTDAELLAWLTRLRVRVSPRHHVLPLSELTNWEIGDGEIRERSREHGFRARHFQVHALGREVEDWDQPLIDSDGIGSMILVAQQRDGVLRFLAKASHEIGFLEGVQCGASVTIAPGERPSEDPVERQLLDSIESGRAVVRMGCRQSEEGGRFFHDENDYAVVELDPGVELPDAPFYRWLSLAQVHRLVRVPGFFSMEFRGVLALLLAEL
ncbi:MAG: NDP-hexose 2,3-dehydratase family protein [Planctomycetes bacterium]|nr:NDP-hexose 2,3-dehydratase family protein [Planctomycetota bacterium]MCB9872259.1 NDP-hexose 2,3-dehydratase family protein [Planctomycetota bacterium]